MHADSTVVCPTEILAFNKALEAFKAINTEIICVSTDSEFTHLAWSQTPRKEGGLGPDLNLTLVCSFLCPSFVLTSPACPDRITRRLLTIVSRTGC